MQKQKLEEIKASQQISREDSRISRIFSPLIALEASNGQFFGEMETIN